VRGFVNTPDRRPETAANLGRKAGLTLFDD
jgi:hypothetical protein